MKSINLRTAFLHKNFRDMGFEMKLVFLMHLATIAFCFMPWISYLPLYGSSYFDNAFNGPTSIIGSIIFLISLAICTLFAVKLLKFKKLTLPVDENIVFLVAGIQQIILIICVWSVLLLIGSGNLSEIRFGISFCLFFSNVRSSCLLFTNSREKTK